MKTLKHLNCPVNTWFPSGICSTCKPRETGLRIKGNRSTKIIGWFSKRWTVSPRDLGSYPSFHRKIGKLIEKRSTITGVHSSFFNHSLWKTSFGVIKFWSRCGVRAKGRQAPKTTAASSTPAVLRASIPAWNLWKHRNIVSQAPKLRFRVVVSSVDIIGRSWGHHGICNLQDLGVQSQDPIYHPTCSNFEWGETNINQINQCLKNTPQWLEQHYIWFQVQSMTHHVPWWSGATTSHMRPRYLCTPVLPPPWLKVPELLGDTPFDIYWLIKVAVSVNGEYRNIADLCWFSAKGALNSLNHGKLGYPILQT